MPDDKEVTKANKQILVSEVVSPFALQMGQFMTYMPNPDFLLYETGQTMRIYREMMMDARIKSLVEIRINEILDYPFYLLPGDTTAEAQRIADAVGNIFIKRLNIYQELKEMLSALKFGFSFAEVIWGVDALGWWAPLSIKARSPERFGFKPDGTPVLLDHGMAELSDPYKFIVHRHDSDAENPYGISVLQACYWAWRFKNAAWRFWLTASEKFGVPTVLALFETDDEDKARERAKMLAEMLSGIQNDAAVALANVKEVTTLEVKGDLSSFNTLIDACDTQFAYAIAGQSLASNEAKFGTQALGKVQETKGKKITAGDARQLAYTLSNTLIAWITELNFGAAAPKPYLEFDLEEYASWEIVRDAMEMGLPVSRRSLYNRYNIPKPIDDKDVFIAVSPASGAGKIDSLALSDDSKKKSSDDTTDTSAPEHLKQEVLKAEELDKAVEGFYQEAIEVFRASFPINDLSDLKKLQDNALQIPASKELAERTRDVLLLSLLMGMDHASSDITLVDYIPEPVTFEEALNFLNARIPISRKAYAALESKLRFRAFSVARLSQFDAIEAVRQHLIKAQSEGKTISQFWSESSQDDLLKKAGLHKSNPWYWETVFRTNIQTDYNAGRLMQFRERPPKNLEFVGIMDSRQSVICRQRSGVIRPYKDAWWASNTPPLHYACRSTLRGIDAAEAKALSQSLTPPQKLKGLIDVQKGFGGDPLETESFYKLTPEMKKRAKQYGIQEEIAVVAKKLGVAM